MLKKLLPKLQVKSIYDIDLKRLWKEGIRGIITDLDNTLVGAADPQATPKLIKWLDEVQQAGFEIVIVSNNNRLRVENFANPLSLPFFYRARKPALSTFRKALTHMQLESAQVVVIGDQLLTDVLGGNRLGLYTILVQPISLQDEGFFTKINRKLERLAYRKFESVAPVHKIRRK